MKFSKLLKQFEGGTPAPEDDPQGDFFLRYKVYSVHAMYHHIIYVDMRLPGTPSHSFGCHLVQLLKKKLKAAADRQEALLASRKIADGNPDESKHEKV